MLRRLFLALLALGLAMPALAAPPPVRDWSKVASRKADGAFVLGNPAAPVKLVEYFSFTCSHCAHFEGEAIASLTADYIRTGRVSYEVRHALRDGYDLAASLLARCAGPAPFFSVTPAVFAAQDKWMAQAAQWLQSKPALDGLPPETLLPKLAAGAGLDALFRRRGLTPQRAQACLANAGERDILTGMADAAWNMPGFPGTPAFTINGQLQQGIASWADLKRALDGALR